MSISRVLVIFLSLVFLGGCASGTFKARQEQRDKMAASSGLYCEFISSDQFPDIDVELNMRMSKRCDSDKNFSVTNHRNASGQNGVLYCCAMEAAVAKPLRRVRPAPKKEAPPANRPEIQDPNAAVIAD